MLGKQIGLALTGLFLLAVELGGFEVQMGTGESTGLPSEWEKSQSSSSDVEIPDVTAYEEYEEELWSGAEIQEKFSADTENVEDFASGNWKEQMADETVDWQVSPESQRSEIYENSNTAEDKTEPPLFSGSSGLSEIEENTDGRRNAEITAGAAVLTEQPADSPPPVPTSIPIFPTTPGTDFSSMIRYENNKMPDVIFWEGETEAASVIRLRAVTDRILNILSLRVNGRETEWYWQGTDIVIENSSADGRILVQAAVFTDYSWTESENSVILIFNTDK